MNDLLSRLKSEKRFAEILFLQNEPQLVGVLLLWKNFPVRFLPPPEPPNGWPPDGGETLWKYCEYDREEFADLLGINRGEAEQALKLLRTLGLIFPDGSINENAEKWLNAQVVKMLPKQNK